MAFVANETKAVIAYGNKVTPALVTQVTTSNCTIISTYPAANLKYEDPWRIMKASAASANPQIIFQFASVQDFTCLGLINHNLQSQGYGVTLQYSTDGGTTWATAVGATSLYNDGNVLLRFPQTGIPRTHWRLTLTKASAWPSFYIGAIFLGQYVEMTRNPLEGGVNQALKNPLVLLESAGEARHVRFGPSKWTSSAEWTFERIDQTHVQTLVETIGRANLRKMIALIPPDQAALVLPIGVEHLFGYLSSVSVAPRMGGTTGVHKADVVLNVEGAM